jgi:protein involved in plasmid replication-relaxation
MSKALIITPIYDKLLRGSETMPVGLYHLHLLTAAQLTRLHYSMGSYKAIRQRLRVLADNGYVMIDAIPEKFTRGPNYYTLGTKGIQYLRDVGLDVDTSLRAAKETTKGYLHIKHLLELNDVFIAALRVSTLDPRLYVADYRHERALKRTPYKTMVQGMTYGLVPDGFLDLRMRREGQSDLRLPVLLENDRGFEREHQFRQKIAAYRAFVRSGAYKQQFNVEGMTILITTYTDLKRVTDLRDWTWREVNTDLALAGRFRFAVLPRPPEPRHLLFERLWYTLTSDKPIALLEG